MFWNVLLIELMMLALVHTPGAPGATFNFISAVEAFIVVGPCIVYSIIGRQARQPSPRQSSPRQPCRARMQTDATAEAPPPTPYP